jgi:hypothetical protein
VEEAPRLEQAGRGFYVCYHGKTLLSRIDPIKQAERAASAAFPLAGKTLYLVPSPLLGYGIPLIMENLPHDSALLGIEADKALAGISREYIRRLEASTSERFRFIQTENPAAVRLFVNRTWGQRRFRRVKTLRLTGGWQLNTTFYDEAADILRRGIATEWSNAMTLTKLGRLYIRNAIRNLGLLAAGTGIETLDFGNSPVIVLGAGPSLDDFLDRLKCEPPPETCRILCVDTALRPLRDRNIKPDLVVALEAQHWNLRDFNGMGDWRIPVAMDMSGLPAVSGLLGGQTYPFWTRWTELSIFERLFTLGIMPAELPPLGSVSLSAVNLALMLGTGAIFTAGIDFSFTFDKYHCRGSPSHSESLRRHTRFGGLYPTAAAFRARQASAVYCGSAGLLSDPAMENYRDMFEAEFSGRGRVFAVAGGGLPLGVPALSFDEMMREIRNHPPPVPAPFSAASRRDNPRVSGKSRAHLIQTFINEEQRTLYELLGILKGGTKARAGRLDSLLDSASYLWAHFPDCAGAGGARPSSGDIIFLKRVRAEIEPFIKTWQTAAHLVYRR